MARPVTAIRATVGAAFSAFGRLAQRSGQAISLVPVYLAGLLWLLQQTFEDLARKGYGGNAAVYAVLRVLCRAIPEPPLIPYGMNGDGSLGEPLPWQHPLRALIRRPNELMSEPRMWELITLHVGIIGRSVWLKERDNAGNVIALWPLRPDRVGPIYSTSTQAGERVITGWSYLIPGTVEYVPLARADCVAYVSPDPAGDSGGIVEGLGPLQALAAEVSADNEATKYVGALIANSGTPSVVITTKTPLPNKEAAELIKASFMREFGGARRGSPAVVDADATVTPMGFNLKDLEFPNLRNITETRIAAAYGVPAILAGLNAGVQSGIRATISEQRELFTETTCASHWRNYEATFTNDVAAEFGEGVACLFDLTKVKALQQQGRYEIEKLSTGFAQGAVSFDEYRTRVLQLPPVGGDFGASFLVPTTSGVTPTDDRETDLSPEDSDLVNEDPHLHVIAGRAPTRVPAPTPTIPVSAPRRVVTPTAGKALRAVKAAPEGATPAHAQMAKANAARRRQIALDRHSGPLLEYLHSLGAAMAEQVRRRATVKAVWMDDTTPPPDESAKLRKLLEAIWLDNLQGAYEDASDTLGVPIPFDLAPDVQEALDDIAARAAAIDQTTTAAVRTATDTANASNHSVATLAAAIASASAFGGGRALAIARSEAATAYNRGTALAYKHSGLVRAVQVSDGIHDQPCADANGQIWSLDDAMANPLQHPNCRREFAPVMAPASALSAA